MAQRARSVLVTGGTRGLGKAIGLEFAHTGARVFLTHRWGSVDEETLRAEFVSEGLPPPSIVEADASDSEATRQLMATIRDEAGGLDVVISNVAFAGVVHDLHEYRRVALELSLRYSAWPVVDLVQASREVLGSYPRYVIAVSSGGGDRCYGGYAFAGTAKSALETLCRYAAIQLRPEGVRVNVIRPGYIDTASARAILGEESLAALHERAPEVFVAPRRVAQVAVALSSGLMDAVTGQTIVVDEGWSLIEPTSFLSGQPLPAGFPIEDR